MALALNLGLLTLGQLRAMADAGGLVRTGLDRWRANNRRVIDEFVTGEPVQDEFTHYPGDDVRDPVSGAQYFYHCHRGAQEHGHFHVFLRRAGMPPRVRARRWSRSVPWPRGSNKIAHLVAISMSVEGLPQALFCTNRWVTDETPFGARTVVEMLDRFRPSADGPFAAAGLWLNAMIVLFRPQIEFLLHHRDQVLLARRRRFPGDVLEDPAVEVTGLLAIDIDAQRRAVAAALARLQRGQPPEVPSLPVRAGVVPAEARCATRSPRPKATSSA